MQDDVYLITDGGWAEGKKLRQIIKVKGEKVTEDANIVVGKLKFKADLIPPELIVARYFGGEKNSLDSLLAELESITQEITEIIEENGGDEGLLSEVTNDSGKVTKTAVTGRLKQIKKDPDADEERELLENYLALLNRESDAKADVKSAEEGLNRKVVEKYGSLSEDEIKTLVVDDKWAASLCSDIKDELDRVSQRLTGRIKELSDRYETPLPEIESEVEVLSAKVQEHLKRMGFSW